MTTDSESDEAILDDVPDVKEVSKKASASLFTGDERLRTDFRKFSDGGDNVDGEPDFISHTDDGDIIVLFTTPRINEDLGTVNASIRVYSFPPSGMDHDWFRGSYSLADLTLERTIPLPANFTDPDGDPHFGKCLVVLHPDEWISMACGRSSHNNQLVTSMRLDFPNYNISVPDRTGAFFAWDQHDVLQNAWFPNASWCSVSQGPAFAWDGNELVRHTPSDTFVTDVCVDGTASFPNGNASCAVTQAKCRILVEVVTF